jgi:hypothetical protein
MNEIHLIPEATPHPDSLRRIAIRKDAQRPRDCGWNKAKAVQLWFDTNFILTSGKLNQTTLPRS